MKSEVMSKLTSMSCSFILSILRLSMKCLEFMMYDVVSSAVVWSICARWTETEHKAYVGESNTFTTVT